MSYDDSPSIGGYLGERVRHIYPARYTPGVTIANVLGLSCASRDVLENLSLGKNSRYAVVEGLAA